VQQAPRVKVGLGAFIAGLSVTSSAGTAAATIMTSYESSDRRAAPDSRHA
jgi:hypothetical protein